MEREGGRVYVEGGRWGLQVRKELHYLLKKRGLHRYHEISLTSQPIFPSDEKISTYKTSLKKGFRKKIQKHIALFLFYHPLCLSSAVI